MRKSKEEKSAFELIDEAIYILRRFPVDLLLSYYIGTMPFILGLLYFWADMSRNAFADTYCAPASLGMALLFVWMKYWHSIFGSKVIARVTRKMENSGTSQNQTHRHILRTVAIQCFIHASGLIIMPVCALLTIPFAWCYAFYQNICAQEKFQDVRSVWKNAWQQCLIYPKQNHIILSVFFLFGIFVFINITATIITIPYFLKRFLGIETMFTMSGNALFNTTFWASAFCFTYLCMDPLVKTVYALRCFYGQAIRSGEDLKAELSEFLIK